ncbi:chaps-domain-containing protein [Anaeramoeba ignava]|uniref:Chaps-domain-containing protein n=1 Tax=Anaeramoeba ignava TaxID=1746090 RepID=A0A9Q0RAQ1_ANAIG|nr:chaps-domain-containing protein [Anaeramoeba ignava]
MSDVLSLTHEAEEAIFGESLLAREIQLKLIKTGLGPLDLCHVIKTESFNHKKKTKTNQKAHKVVGFYHYVIGVDTSNIGSIVKYLHLLLKSQENARFLKKKWSIVSGGVCVDVEPHITSLISSVQKPNALKTENDGLNESTFDEDYLNYEENLNEKFKSKKIEKIQMKNSNQKFKMSDNFSVFLMKNIKISQNDDDDYDYDDYHITDNNDNYNSQDNLEKSRINKHTVTRINANQSAQKIRKYRKQATVWDETLISSFFRKVISHYINPFQKIPIVNIVENQFDYENENQLFNLTEAVFWKGKKLGCSQPRIVPSNGYNFYVKLVQRYLFGQYRFNLFIKFFTQFLDEEPEVAIPISKAYLKLKDAKSALTVLTNQYKKKINSVPLISQLIKTLLVSNKINKAVKLARHLTSIVPFYPKPYLLLAKAHLRQKNFHSVLVNLNNIPFQTNNNCSRNSIICFDEMFPTPARITIPNSSKFKANFEYLCSQNFEDPIFLKKSGKIPEIKEKSKSKFSDLPSLSLKNPLEKKIYKILIDFSNEYGWERMMESRVEVFQKNIRSLVGNKKKKRVPFGEIINYNFQNFSEITQKEKDELIEIIEENESKMIQKAKNMKT